VDRPEDPNGDTFDYGLAPGDTFEPDQLDEISRTQPHIMTVLGPVEPGALGVTNLLATFTTTQDDQATILREIEETGFVGINALLNFTPLAGVEQAERVRWLAGRSDRHLLVTTAPRSSDNDGLANLLDHIERGIDGSGVFPAAILTSTDPPLLRAADRARALTGLPLIIRLDETDTDSTLLKLLETEAIDPSGVTLAGDTDLDSARRLLKAGLNLIIDLERGEAAIDQASLIARLVQEGFAEQLLPGFNPRTGMDALSYVEGSRWSWLIEQFPLLLLDAGLDALTVRTLLIENPNRVLTIEPPAAPGSSEESS
jgi:hypothetical protein